LKIECLGDFYMTRDESIILARQGFTLIRNLLEYRVSVGAQQTKIQRLLTGPKYSNESAAHELAEALHNLDPDNDFLLELTRKNLAAFVEKYSRFRATFEDFL
tara:strand:+ start:127 stop:435 length:309 start_codon:yes stop_codon:yes gene_type:complete